MLTIERERESRSPDERERGGDAVAPPALHSHTSLFLFHPPLPPIVAGPTLPARINAGLIDLLERDGFFNVSEAVGADVKGVKGGAYRKK